MYYYYYNDPRWDRWIAYLCWLCFIVFWLFVATVFQGCKTNKEIITDTVYVAKTSVIHDSITIYRHDSVSLDYKQGAWRIDTLRLYNTKLVYATKIDTIIKYKEKIVYRNKQSGNISRDSTYKAKNSKKTKIVYKLIVYKLSDVQKFFFWSGILAYIMGTAWILWRNRSLIRKIITKI